ncbi:unnamed protein product [Darwinula stevensoni]|uniref:Uncharacterized protein n=1 Tax=Darwinula stevensoni TaxID=69355 RepID=A0A7R9AE78_9CRUS|nr:unnamed protein product [Darwinula stevensoni]CAG0901354.1 unnamed protein product [Darwinula stevensoni]
MAASKVIAKFTTQLEYVNIDGLLLELWKEGVIKPQPYFEALKKPFEEKLAFVQLQLSIGGEDVFPKFLKCLRTLNHWQLASNMEAEWNRERQNGNAQPGSVSSSNEAIPGAAVGTSRQEGMEYVNTSDIPRDDIPENGRGKDQPDASGFGSNDDDTFQPQYLDISLRRAETFHGPPDMKKMIKSFAHEKDNFARCHENSDCCAVVVMSHGDQSDRTYVIYSKDHKRLPVEWVIQNFSNEETLSLRGKPKLFFFQACRGSEHYRSPSESSTETDSYNARCTSPLVQADIFVANAAIPHYVSYRNKSRGSWFIESICQVFMDNAHCLDLRSMMDEVHNRLAKYEGVKGEKQSPEYWVRGNFKKLYFNPGF